MLGLSFHVLCRYGEGLFTARWMWLWLLGKSSKVSLDSFLRSIYFLLIYDSVASELLKRRKRQLLRYFLRVRAQSYNLCIETGRMDACETVLGVAMLVLLCPFLIRQNDFPDNCEPYGVCTEMPFETYSRFVVMSCSEEWATSNCKCDRSLEKLKESWRRKRLFAHSTLEREPPIFSWLFDYETLTEGLFLLSG